MASKTNSTDLLKQFFGENIAQTFTPEEQQSMHKALSAFKTDMMAIRSEQSSLLKEVTQLKTALPRINWSTIEAYTESNSKPLTTLRSMAEEKSAAVLDQMLPNLEA